MRLTSQYRVLPWARGPLTLLKSIARVATRLASRKTGKSSNLLTSFFLVHHNSMITAEAIMIRMNSINHQVLHSSPIVLNERAQTSRRFSGNPTLMFAAICLLLDYNILHLFILFTLAWKFPRNLSYTKHFDHTTVVFFSYKSTTIAQAFWSCQFHTNEHTFSLVFDILYNYPLSVTSFSQWSLLVQTKFSVLSC